MVQPNQKPGVDAIARETDKSPSNREAWTEDQATETYQEAVRRSFAFLKGTQRLDDLWARSIPLENGAGSLVPLCELHVNDQELIEKLATWRAENAFAFPSQFTPTTEGTASWLRSKVLDAEDRIIFLVVDKHGAPVGHMGFDHAINDDREFEVESVLRGVKGVQSGIMGKAIRALIHWAENTLGPRGVFLHVFADNEHAIEFYRRLGWVDGELLPLRKCQEDEGIYYRAVSPGDTAPPDRYFLRMLFMPGLERGARSSTG